MNIETEIWISSYNIYIMKLKRVYTHNKTVEKLERSVDVYFNTSI